METINHIDGIQELDTLEEKRDSMEGAKFSAETAFRDESIGASLVKMISGIFGVIVLFSAISNVANDIKAKKKNPWTYSRIVLDFGASGALIGYALEKTVLGIIIGILIGLFVVCLETEIRKKQLAKHATLHL